MNTFMTISRLILLRMRNVSNKSCREHQDTCFISYIFFRRWCRLWDNVEEYGAERPQMTIRRRVACWINKATCAQVHSRVCTPTTTHTHTHTHTHAIFIAFPRQQWFRECASMLRYTCTVCVVCLCDNEKENYYDEVAKPVNFWSCTK